MPAHLLDALTNRACRAASLGIGCGYVMRVAGVAIADYLGEYLCAARLGVFHLLKHQHARALAHRKACAPLVERQRGNAGIVGFAQRLAVAKARHAQRLYRGFRAARDYRGGVAVLYRAVRLATVLVDVAHGGHDGSV